MYKWRIGDYLRRSFDDGENQESDTIKNQRELIQNFVKKNKDMKIVKHYTDDGYTGTDFNRPGFQEMLNDIKNGKINTIIVKDLSRLGRNYIEVGDYVERVFPLYNIRFISINDNIDSFKDPKSANNAIVPIKNVMNDEYARDISNKIRSSLNTKQSNGEFIGLSAPFGYLKDPKNKHKFIVDKKAAKVVKKIFSMALDGKSKKEIIDNLNNCRIMPPSLYKRSENIAKGKVTKTMNIWKPKMVDRILQNRAYTGDLVQGKRKRISYKVHVLQHTNSLDWIIYPNHHSPLISKDEFELIQDIFYNRDTRICNNKKYDIFSGCLTCSDCGNSLTLKKGRTYEYYYCSSYLRKKECSKHSISKNKLENMVLELVNNQINLLVDIDEKINEIVVNDSINYDIEILNCRLDDLNKNIDKYVHLKEEIKYDLENNYITKEEYEEYKNDYNRKLKQLKIEIEETANKLKKIDFESETDKEWITKFKNNKNLEELNKKTVNELIDNIYIHEHEKIDIIFRYNDEYIEAMNFIKQHNYDII